VSKGTVHITMKNGSAPPPFNADDLILPDARRVVFMLDGKETKTFYREDLKRISIAGDWSRPLQPGFYPVEVVFLPSEEGGSL
jgi:hypothetical protein